MKYRMIRQEIKSGDVFAFRGTSPISRFIRGWTGNSYSHVGIAWVSHGRNFILQDKEGVGIQLCTLTPLLPCDWIKTDVQWTDELEQFSFNNLGQGYSYVNAIRAGLGLTPVGNDRICSEFAASILQQAKVLDDSKIILTPADLVNNLLDIGKTLQIVNS